MAKPKEKVVFSTRTGDLRKQESVSSRPRRSLPPAQQNLKITRETKGRKGKTVTVIAGFALSETDLNDLAKILKMLCGAGGAVKHEDGSQVIEVQGDHRDKVADKLKTLGYKVKQG